MDCFIKPQNSQDIILPRSRSGGLCNTRFLSLKLKKKRVPIHRLICFSDLCVSVNIAQVAKGRAKLFSYT